MTAIKKMEYMRDMALEKKSKALAAFDNYLASLWDLKATTWQHAIDFAKDEGDGK